MWECIYRRKGYQCNAKVKLSPLDEYLDEIHKHTHAPSQTECQVTKVKASIKRRAKETEETTQQILGTELRNISHGAAANLPLLETLCRYVRHSHQDKNIPLTPAHREDIPDLPPAYRTTANGDLFLVYDSGVGDGERIFIFASQDALQFLADPEFGMLIVHSGSVRKFCSNCILYMVSVAKEIFLVCFHFCQIKTKALTINYFNSYSNS